MTLLDFPGKVACTVFLQGCNFRCPFCHNASLLSCASQELLPREEVMAFLKKRVGILDGVCVTGGEPTLQKELPEFLSEIKALGYAVKLDTNGAHPEMLRRVLQSHLVDYVAMDIKNCPQRYAETVGVKNLNLAPVEESATLLLEGTVPYEFRTTAVAELHTKGDFRNIGQWLSRLSEQKAQRYFLQCYVDRDSVLKCGLHAPETAALQNFLEEISPYVHRAETRGF